MLPRALGVLVLSRLVLPLLLHSPLRVRSLSSPVRTPLRLLGSLSLTPLMLSGQDDREHGGQAR